MFIDVDVSVGDDCKIQNYACLYRGLRVGQGVFIGPHVVFANDKHPRATDREFNVLTDEAWECGSTVVADGASIGASATILSNVTVGAWSLVGAGALVTSDVPPHTLVVGAPARQVARVCDCGARTDGSRCKRCGAAP